jgi:hypothetical protein
MLEGKYLPPAASDVFGPLCHVKYPILPIS